MSTPVPSAMMRPAARPRALPGAAVAAPVCSEYYCLLLTSGDYIRLTKYLLLTAHYLPPTDQPARARTAELYSLKMSISP